MNMSIDPRFVTVFGTWTSILLLIAAAGPQFFDGALPAWLVPMVVKWCAILGAINSCVLTGGSGFSSAKAGPWTNAAPPIVPTIVKILIAAFVLSLFLPMSEAMAQTKVKLPIPLPSPSPGCDPLNLKPGCREAAEQADLNKLKSIITKPMQDLVDFISGGLDDAANLAIAIPDLQDGNGYACWTQLKQAGAVFKVHPVPVTLNVAADLEAVRLIHMTATRVCNNPACTQVFNEATNVIAAAAPLKSPIPSMTQLCAQIPPIAIVAPTDLPTPLPSPTPSLGVFKPSAAGSAGSTSIAPLVVPSPTPTP
jgi:hypothetical protein